MQSPWKNTLHQLIVKKVMSLVCIDEVHLFVHFGTTFRTNFGLLKTSLFRSMIDKNHVENSNFLPTVLHIPLLFMTATFNLHLLQLLQKLTGIRILPINFFWCGKRGMSKRNIKITMTVTPQYIRQLKTILPITLKSNSSLKCIVYSNTAQTAERLKDEIDGWIDLTNPTVCCQA